MASEPGTPAVLGTAPEGPDPLLGACDQAVIQTILDSRAPATRALYANRWEIFSEWCSACKEVPASFSVPIILWFLQSLLEKKLSAFTLRVYVAAVSARHIRVDNQYVGSHTLVTRSPAANPPPPWAVMVPSWDLPLVLEALHLPPFEPLEQLELKWSLAKFAFLLAIGSAQCVSELHALSMSVRLAPAHSNQVIELASYDPSCLQEEEANSIELLCPGRALRRYIQATAGFHHCDSLFVCYEGHSRGHVLSKQRLSRWIVGTIEEAYRSTGLPLPPNIIYQGPLYQECLHFLGSATGGSL
ncbi:hypothetical protein N1851_024747 [Merluccius polli]|uniref:Uncharacterized protein n=1 Tax=Merluccius polli TaxID=89951 RepID=A0AA47MEB0_MERPO|nr:hypothetical protein N1851_024747 [Merluccius polli]